MTALDHSECWDTDNCPDACYATRVIEPRYEPLVPKRWHPTPRWAWAWFKGGWEMWPDHPARTRWGAGWTAVRTAYHWATKEGRR